MAPGACIRGSDTKNYQKCDINLFLDFLKVDVSGIFRVCVNNETQVLLKVFSMDL